MSVITPDIWGEGNGPLGNDNEWDVATASCGPTTVGLVIFLSRFEHRASCKGPFRSLTKAGTLNYTNKFAWYCSWILSARQAWLGDFASEDASFSKSILLKKIAGRGWSLSYRAQFDLWALSRQIVGSSCLCFDPLKNSFSIIRRCSVCANRSSKTRSETSPAAEPAVADVTLGW